MPPLGVDTVRRDDEVVVVLRGEFDLCTAPLLQGVLAGDQVQDARSVLVDLDNVAFMDLSGLRPLVSLALPARDDFRVTLTAGSSQVQWLLELTGLRYLLNVAPPSADA
ncbi:MAG TPA: STAS domain-containing protein [Solirubrobacteraceae bacterium]|nr:STAS domain-containing protein [Solirubrobacteraceae bacterium]